MAQGTFSVGPLPNGRAALTESGSPVSTWIRRSADRHHLVRSMNLRVVKIVYRRSDRRESAL